MSVIEIFEFLFIVPHLPAMFAYETVNLRCLHILNAKEGWYLRKNRRNGPCRWGVVQKRLFGDLTLSVGRLSKYQTNKQERLGAGEELSKTY